MIYLALALSLVSAQSGSGIDSKQAAAVASDFARKLGVHGLTVEKSELSADPDWSTPNKPSRLEILTCSTPDGKKYVCQVIPPKKVISFVQQDEGLKGITSSGPDPKFDPAHPPKEFDPQPLGMSALKAVGAKGPYQYRPLRAASDNPVALAVFDLTVRGHRFLNTFPRYAYTVRVNIKTSEVLSFDVPPPLPRVNADKPKVNEKDAKALLAQWAARNSKRDPAAVLFCDGRPGTNTLTPELGYLKFDKEPTARLVWQGRVTRSYGDGSPFSGFSLKICVDALTGELINPGQPLGN